jgi:hypothetical protein
MKKKDLNQVFAKSTELLVDWRVNQFTSVKLQA